jgi:hypothetical protein
MAKHSIIISEGKVKKIRDEFFVDSNQLSEEMSLLAKNEKSDCVVRAFMSTLEIPYDNAHNWVKKYLKRENRKGTYTRKYIGNIIGKTKNYNRISIYGVSEKYKFGKLEKAKLLKNKTYKKRSVSYTVKSFMETHPNGKYVLIVKGHALGLVNGVLYGNKDEQYKGFKRSIQYVIKVGK